QPFYLLALSVWLGHLWDGGRKGLVVAYVSLAAGVFVYFYPFVSGQPVPGSQAAMFFVLPTWQYDCQFYPSFVCPVYAPSDVPIAAVALRLGTAAAVAGLAAALFLGARSPVRALGVVRDLRDLLGRRARRGSDAG
ncbi:MAG: hypothetical protein DMF93_24180, partial [Acidobacteria bacterium]